ncbi:hypothetical protein GCM10027176_60840 [Actinoallomurus bryophytorum]|uniref:Uncharacterized protein DUF1232 n=1 Tax=Actinoallomurus bryophytorum TaxID=1490222 RepID=A0A543CPH9_9ACTN|nr:DUF1232 domain-containing protein [Actinoallomurus bryophytorum]TQL98880.1 uncharacterized protein DUF1232 [Actinoallomurus bryophytorum]
MVLPGVLALFAGAILTFAVHGHVGDVGVNTIGVITMALGSVILIAGLLRMRRGRGRGRGRSGRLVANAQDRVYRTSKGKIIAMIIAVVYIVSPIDFIPDFLLPVGVVDDAGAFGWLLFAIGQEMSRKRAQPQRSPQVPQPQPPRQVPPPKR